MAGEMRSVVVVCLHLFHLCHLTLHLHPLSARASLLLFLSPHCHPFHLFPLHLCLLVVSSPSLPAPPPPSLPPIPPVISFPAKRLAGIFSTMVTFKTECHHCLLLSLTCLLFCPLFLCLHLSPTPILLLQWGPSGPSAVPGRVAGINTAL